MTKQRMNYRMSAWSMLALGAAGLVLACSSDTKPGATAAGGSSGIGGSGGTAGTTGVAGDSSAPGGTGATAGTTSAAGGSSATGGSSAAACPALPDLGVRFVGRVDACGSSGVRMAWSGTGFIGKFKGTGINVHLNDSPNQYTVLIDSTLMPKLITVAGDQTYTLASGLTDAEHTVEFYRRTEAS